MLVYNKILSNYAIVYGRFLALGKLSKRTWWLPGGMFMVVKTQVLHIKDVIIVSIKIKGEKNIQK